MEWKILLSMLIGYLLGSLNTSIIVGRLIYGKDVRKYGSGNAGATNTLRTFGRTAALLVVLGDALKGISACIIGYYITGHGKTGLYLAGFSAVLGHNWPLYFKFKGGKGVMTTFAVAVFMSPKAALISLAVFIIAVLLTRYISVGSLIAALALPFAVWVFEGTPVLIGVFTVLAILVIVRHRENIKRLIEGKENKVNFNQNK